MERAAAGDEILVTHRGCARARLTGAGESASQAVWEADAAAAPSAAAMSASSSARMTFPSSVRNV
jgi:antitoxin (DNA-binding transcriptional repressor) of toxin-antitoxin stability system